MPDDQRDNPGASDFDDWLAADPAPSTDPVAPSSQPDETGELDIIDTAEAFYDHEEFPEEPVVEFVQEPVIEVVEEPVVAFVQEPVIEVPDEPVVAFVQEPIVEFVQEPVVEVAEEPVIEFEAFVGGNDADTGELEIIDPSADPLHGAFQPEPDDVPAVVRNISPLRDPVDDIPEFLDPFGGTTESVVSGDVMPDVPASAGSVSFGDLWGDDTGETVVPRDVGVEADFVLGEDGRLHGATREHFGLAEAIAAADTQDTEQVALVAEIPGLEPTVVGFEDVVEAEGYRKVRARASGDLLARVTTGAVLVVALIASLFWRPALVVLAMAVFVLGAGEFYTALLRSKRAPVSLFGFLGIVGAGLGAFWWSAAAIPIAFILATVLLLLYYAVVPGKTDPMANLALTTTVMVWAGLGSFAMLIARSDDYQTLILGVVLTVVGADVAAFFVGRSLGRTHFAPWVSPNKTVEGLVAGTLVAIAIGAMLHFVEPFELTSGLAVGVVAAVFTPLGDLAMSAAKRALGLKDMGSVLPGHGGFLDRIDGLLFAIPAAWAVFIFSGLL